MYRYFKFTFFFIAQASFSAFVILGVPSHISQNILQRIEYKARNIPEEITDQTKDQLIREAREAIKPFGYFNPNITITHNAAVSDDIQIKVDLNQIAHIQKITLIPNEPSVNKDLMESLQQSISSYKYTTFSIDNISNIMASVKKAALDAGYYDVLVTRGETSVNRYTNLADLTVIVAPKQKNQHGRIILPEGACPSCFNRYHNIQEGETYSDARVREFQTNMIRSGLFKSSQVKVQPRELEPHVQDLVVEYENVDPYKYFFGIGMRANLSEKKLVPELQTRFTFNNLGSCGIKQTNAIHVSPSNTISGQSQLIIPSESSVDDVNIISVSYSDSNIKAEDFSKSFQLYALSQKTIASWEHQLSANLLMEESTLNQNNSYITTLIYPQYQLLKKMQKDQNSLQLKLKARGGLKALGSGVDFFQFTTSAKLKSDLKPFMIRNRTTYGKIITDEFEHYPLSMQYFLGGGNSLRGLDYHEINEGKSFFLSRNSIQFRLPRNILIGGFYDNGYCTNTDSYTLHPSAGVLLSYSANFGTFDFSVGRLVNGSKWVVLFHAEPGEELR